MSNNDTATPERVPVRDGLLTTPLSDLDAVRLVGCRCTACGETSLGRKAACPNCGADTVHDVALGDRGSLWTYTVVRHRPPGDYKGPDPFVPYGLGLVELPEGLRVMSPIRCHLSRLAVGLALRFRAYGRRDGAGREVVAFDFEPAESEAARG